MTSTRTRQSGKIIAANNHSLNCIAIYCNCWIIYCLIISNQQRPSNPLQPNTFLIKKSSTPALRLTFAYQIFTERLGNKDFLEHIDKHEVKKRSSSIKKYTLVKLTCSGEYFTWLAAQSFKKVKSRNGWTQRCSNWNVSQFNFFLRK